MPERSRPITKSRESSIQFMLSEFNRIQTGESYNRSSGDTRVNLYLTLLSLTIASLITLWQLTDKLNPQAVQFFYAATCAFLLFVSMVGIVGFRLLLERWKSSVIYLKKLARIRRWFLHQDHSIKSFLVYAADENYNRFASKDLVSSSLVTLVSILNSICISVSIGFLIKTLFIDLSFVFFIAVLPVSFVFWLFHVLFMRVYVKRLDEDKYSAFPAAVGDENDNI